MERFGCQQLTPAAGGTNPKAAAYPQDRAVAGRAGLTRKKLFPWLECRREDFVYGRS